MPKVIKLKRGLNINAAGKAEKKPADNYFSDTYALKPTDFIGMERAKSLVNEGDSVKAGTPLFYDKKNPKVKYVSPVSGEIAQIIRGEKRAILEIRILADSSVSYVEFPKHSVSQLDGLSREAIVDLIAESGVWPQIIQRPFAIVADPGDTPRNIFISAFDSSPLAPDYDFIFKGEEQYFQAGLNVLRKLTPGTVHLNLNADTEASSIFSKATGVQINRFSGPHPAGNVGVQIHHLDPIIKGDVVWTLNPFGVIQIGKLFLEGRYDAAKTIALTGSEVKSPSYYRTYIGANIDKLVSGRIRTDREVRYVSGNILTGTRILKDGYLGYYHHQLTVIPEGNYSEFLGWILPTFDKFSFHRALGLLSFVRPNREYVLDTNMHGEERPFVQTGVFERLVPMDLYPIYLLKAILANDYDGMEALGIYELAEEDLALCEFADVSKNRVQAILRQGIELIQNS
jgi:Na+-transporting NADH:ubiquinone oxidoreductase subunit A